MWMFFGLNPFLVQIQRDPNQGEVAYSSVVPSNAMYGEARSGKIWAGMVA